MNYLARQLLRRASLPLLGVVLLAAAATTGCQSGPVPAAEYVSQAEQIHEQALASTATIDRDLNDYVAEIGRRILAGAAAADAGNTRDPTLANMRFHLVASDTVNAFGTGGGHVYVYNGLFKECQTEEELAAVMAHAFAHAVDLDHQRNDLRPAAAAGAGGDPEPPLDVAVFQFAAHRYTRAQEEEADARAFEFYCRGGWDPGRFYALFERLADRPPQATAPDRQPLRSRAIAARDRLQRLPVAARNWRKPTVADPVTFRELRDKAARGREPAGPLPRPLMYLRVFPNCVLPADTAEQRAAQEQLLIDITPRTPERGSIRDKEAS